MPQRVVAVYMLQTIFITALRGQRFTFVYSQFTLFSSKDFRKAGFAGPVYFLASTLGISGCVFWLASALATGPVYPGPVGISFSQDLADLGPETEGSCLPILACKLIGGGTGSFGTRCYFFPARLARLGTGN